MKTDIKDVYSFTVWTRTRKEHVESNSMNHAVAKFAGCGVHFLWIDQDNVHHYQGENDRLYKAVNYE